MHQVVHRNADGELVIWKKLGSRQRGYLVETWHHGHYAAGVATFKRDIDMLAESLLNPGRARCHAIGPDWDSYHLMSDEPSQCPSTPGRVAPYPPQYDTLRRLLMNELVTGEHAEEIARLALLARAYRIERGES